VQTNGINCWQQHMFCTNCCCWPDLYLLLLVEPPQLQHLQLLQQQRHAPQPLHQLLEQQIRPPYWSLIIIHVPLLLLLFACSHTVCCCCCCTLCRWSQLQALQVVQGLTAGAIQRLHNICKEVQQPQQLHTRQACEHSSSSSSSTCIQW
jgi:hypothetical protein